MASEAHNFMGEGKGAWGIGQGDGRVGGRGSIRPNMLLAGP